MKKTIINRMYSFLLVLVMLVGILQPTTLAVSSADIQEAIYWGIDSSGEHCVTWDPTILEPHDVWVWVIRDGIKYQGFWQENSGELSLGQILRDGGNGDYEIRIISRGTYNDKEIASAVKTITFASQLATPVLSFNKETGILSWNSVAGAHHYTVSVVLDGYTKLLSYKTVYENYIDVSAETLYGGTYEFSVIAYNTDNDGYASSKEGCLTITLESGITQGITGFRIRESVASWNDFPEATRYWITIRDKNGTAVYAEYVNESSVDLTEVFDTYSTGEYSFTLVACNNKAVVSETLELTRTIYKVVTEADAAECTVEGAGYYESRSIALIKPIPNPGYEFIMWVDSRFNLIGLDDPYMYTVTQNKYMKAVFRKIPLEFTTKPTNSEVYRTDDSYFEWGISLTTAKVELMIYNYTTSSWENLADITGLSISSVKYPTAEYLAVNKSMYKLRANTDTETVECEFTVTWAPIPFGVFYYTDEDVLYIAQRVTEGSMAEEPTPPTKDGYIFAGWTLDGELYDFSTPVNGSTNLIAKWEVAPPLAFTAEPQSGYATKEDGYTVTWEFSVPVTSAVLKIYHPGLDTWMSGDNLKSKNTFTLVFPTEDFCSDGKTKYMISASTKSESVECEFTVTWTDDESLLCNKDDSCPMSPFTDLNISDWYHDGIHFCVKQGLMNGTGSGSTFSPSMSMSRAMVVTVLYRLEGSPVTTGDMPFTDIKSDWYADAVKWAYQNNIVTGVTASKFDPDGNVTREQIATILYRYAGYKGLNTSKSVDINTFPDAAKTGSWAETAVKWAVAEGLITGAVKDGVTVLDPTGVASRAQVATILYRFCKI